MRTIQKKPLTNHPKRKRPSEVRVFKWFAEVEVFSDDEPHRIDSNMAEEVAKHRWVLAKGGYAQSRIDGQTIRLHQFVFGSVPNGRGIDHIDRDNRNNCRANLRVATQGLNNHNVSPRGRSRFKGVHWEKTRNKWRVEIRINRRHFCIGRFDDEMEAACAYDQAAVEHYGTDAVTNFESSA